MDINNENSSIIKNQFFANNITKESIIKLFLFIDRTMFVDKKDIDLSYMDENYFFNEKRFMLKMSTIGKLLIACKKLSFLNVLNIGSGTGYSSILLSQISENVLSLEKDKSLHEKEKKILNSLDNKNINSIHGNLETGLTNHMPYDLIFVNGCLLEKPQNLLNQLDINGNLVCIEKLGENLKKIVRYESKNKLIQRKEFSIVNAPILL